MQQRHRTWHFAERIFILWTVKNVTLHRRVLQTKLRHTSLLKQQSYLPSVRQSSWLLIISKTVSDPFSALKDWFISPLSLRAHLQRLQLAASPPLCWLLFEVRGAIAVRGRCNYMVWSLVSDTIIIRAASTGESRVDLHAEVIRRRVVGSIWSAHSLPPGAQLSWPGRGTEKVCLHSWPCLTFCHLIGISPT